MSVVKKEDFESLVVIVSLAAILVMLGTFGSFLRTADIELPNWAPIGGKVRLADSGEMNQRFQQGVIMLHSKQYEYAATAFQKVLELSPRLPEAHSNMGYALLGLEEYKLAHDYFISAINLRPNLSNSYYGLAMAMAGMEDYEGALGAMRSYIHLSAPKTIAEQAQDPYLRKARAALWEWEQKLGRLPPNPTAGVISFEERENQVDNKPGKE
jgi:tetratricopeptide (TPR) repeat protein